MDIQILLNFNKHWKTGRIEKELAPQKKKEIFSKVIDYLNLRQIISLTGLRRVGKTTLMFQLMEHLINAGINPKNILYFSFDEISYKLSDIIASYEKEILNEEIGKVGRVFIFLDEIQKLANWQNQIKIFYDMNHNIKFLISGSSSLFIRKRSVETLAGRLFELRVSPLTFREFLDFNYNGLYENYKKNKNKNLFNKEMNIRLKEFFYKSFPETLHNDLNFAVTYTKSIIEKISYDILDLFKIEDREMLKKLINIFISRPGMILNYNNMASELGTNRIILSRYTDYLEEAFLIKKIYNFSKNIITSEKKLKKVYPSSTSFCFSYTPPDDSIIVENLIAIFTNARFFWRDKEKHEVDFILEEKNILPIEVKFKDNITNKDLKSLLKFMDKFELKKGLIISKEINRDISIRGKKVTIIPAWALLLEK